MRNSTRAIAGRKAGMNKKSLFVKAAAVLIALCMIAALALPAFAASAETSEEEYTYTVRIFPGNSGTIDGSDEPFIKKDVAPGYAWSRSDFDYQTRAKAKKDKYYVTSTATSIS